MAEGQGRIWDGSFLLILPYKSPWDLPQNVLLDNLLDSSGCLGLEVAQGWDGIPGIACSLGKEYSSFPRALGGGCRGSGSLKAKIKEHKFLLQKEPSSLFFQFCP